MPVNGDSLKQVIQCPYCLQKLRVPVNRGTLKITCSNLKCRRSFFWDAGQVILNNITKPCRHCAETIMWDAKKCKYCGEWQESLYDKAVHYSKKLVQWDPFKKQNEEYLKKYKVKETIIPWPLIAMFLVYGILKWLKWI